MTTMRDVAAAAGVSAKTVSRVFNDDPHVHPETRTRVEQVMRSLDYLPNTLATTFRTGRSSVIGVAVPDLVDPFFASIVRSVEETAFAERMSVLVTSLGDDPARERDILESVLHRQLAGLVVAPISHDQSHLASWAARLPIVFADRAPAGVNADCFIQDDRKGAREAAEHLLRLGHRRIAFLGDTAALPTTSARLSGYLDALQDSAVPVDDELVAFGTTTRGAASDALDRMAALGDPVTAVFSSNVRCTMAAVPAMAERPLALVGFGDFPLADALRPSVTVIQQDAAQLGRLAANRVLDRSARPGGRFRRRTVLPVSLVVRGSSTPPPASV